MSRSLQPLAWLNAALLATLLAWDASGLDLTLALHSGGPSGFPLRDNWWLTTVLHQGGRYAGWLVAGLLCLAVVWPAGALRRMPVARRVQLPATALLALAAVALLKSVSGTSCPWDLADFGGTVRHLSHWNGWLSSDGGSGRCFPAGHATTGFAFVGGYFALREAAPRLARSWLTASAAIGLTLGLAQQLRGAHFMSHTLWTGWICWMVGWLSNPLFSGSPPASTSLGKQTRP